MNGAALGDESSVGMGCMIGKGASLGPGAALAAGSVLTPGTAVPAKQLWGGNPAVQIGDVGADAAAGVVRTAEVTAELAKIHMEEAWKDLQLVEQEHEDYKREKVRTPTVVPPGGPQVGAASHARRAPRQDGHPLEHVHAPLKHALSLRATGHRACVGASM